MTRRRDMAEAVTNVTVGYALAVLTQVMAFPWFGLHAAPLEHLGLGAIFVGVSLARSFVLRRLFRKWEEHREV